MKRSNREIQSKEQMLLTLLDQRGSIRVSELPEILRWAPSTVRKHVLEMEHRGLIERKHGTVISNRGLLMEEHFDERRDMNLSQKARIAQLAAAQVVPNSTMVLGGGTTCRELSLILARESQGNIIVTPSLEIAMILSNNPRIEVRIPSGSINYRTRYIVGTDVRRYLEGCFVQYAIIGCDALTPQLTIATVNELEADIDRAIVHNSTHVTVITDSSKLGHSSMTKICDAQDIDMLITDSAAPSGITDRLTDAGVAVRMI